MLTPFQRPKKLDCNLETLTETYGCFYAQPFERGFGTTVGNSIRRALYSSMEGAAITAVKIEGVLHEFSSIPGVVEDATDIILNLKRIPFKMASENWSQHCVSSVINQARYILVISKWKKG